MRNRVSIVDYPKQVYQGYKYLFQAYKEISWEQLFLDPIQDTGIEWSFEKMIQAGHSAEEIKLAKCCSGNFIQHLIPHLFQKTVATLAFPFIYPLLNSTANIPGKSIITESAAFFGVNPLEGLYSIDTLPKTLLGEDNIISNGAKYLAFREDYHQDRAKNEDFNQYMKSYKGYMEVCDAWGHARTELKTLYNNKDLSSMPYKAYTYFRLKSYLYSNTIAEEVENDKKIESHKLLLQKQTSSEAKICFANETIITQEQLTCPVVKPISWSDWLYENKWTIAQEIVTPIIFRKIFSEAISYLPKLPSLKNKQQEENSAKDIDPQDDPHQDLPYDAPENPMFWGFDKQENIIFGLFKRQTDDQILEEAAKKLAVENKPFSFAKEEDEEISSFVIAAEGSLSDYEEDLTFVRDVVFSPIPAGNDLPTAKLSPSRSRAFSVEKIDSAKTPPAIAFPEIDGSMNEGSFIDDERPPARKKSMPTFCGDSKYFIKTYVLGVCQDPDCGDDHS